MIEEKLAVLGLALPDAAAPAHHYVPVTLHSGIAYLSGQLPRVDGGFFALGKVGAEVSLEQAQEAARICVLHGLACLKQALGSLEAIERVLKLTEFVASAPGFNYSDAMKAKGGDWTIEDLNKFLTKPQDFVPGTKMTFPGVPRDTQRADLLAYLNSLSDNPKPLPVAKQ